MKYFQNSMYIINSTIDELSCHGNIVHASSQYCFTTLFGLIFYASDISTHEHRYTLPAEMFGGSACFMK